MKKLLFVLLLIVIFSCEKIDLNCYECKTYLNGELLHTVIPCGMDDRGIRDFQMGMVVEARQCYGMEVKVECVIK